MFPGALPALVQLVAFLCGLPESPKWLAGQGRTEEAFAVLKRLRGPNATQASSRAHFERARIDTSDEKRVRDVSFSVLVACDSF